MAEKKQIELVEGQDFKVLTKQEAEKSFYTPLRTPRDLIEGGRSDMAESRIPAKDISVQVNVQGRDINKTNGATTALLGRGPDGQLVVMRLAEGGKILGTLFKEIGGETKIKHPLALYIGDNGKAYVQIQAKGPGGRAAIRVPAIVELSGRAAGKLFKINPSPN
ncbi:MAG: hypothetical protein AB7E52_03845 [Bdellovibrionales bacterium]